MLSISFCCIPRHHSFYGSNTETAVKKIVADPFQIWIKEGSLHKGLYPLSYSKDYQSFLEGFAASELAIKYSLSFAQKIFGCW